jgi:acetate kinase
MPHYLALNKGSSSLKFCLYSEDSVNPIISGKLTNYSPEEFKFSYQIGDANNSSVLTNTDYANGPIFILEFIKKQGIVDKPSPLTIIHRIVHGGNHFFAPTILNTQNISKLEELNSIAPLHNPPAIALVKLIQNKFPEIKQIAVFDTAFHQTLPEINQIYTLPIQAYTKYGIKRFGFHGLSHKYVSSQYYHLKYSNSSEITNPQIKIKQTGKIVTLHIGSGSSLCAIENGKSYQTSMGFSPNEGLPMATRSGEVNFNALNYYLEKENLEWEELGTILNKKSGLLGISNYSGNMVNLVKDYSVNTYAKLAVDYLVERIIEKLGAYISVLNGVEAIIFTGAIGEGSHLVRQKICDKFSFLGLFLDKDINIKSDEPGKSVKISSEISSVKVYIIPSNEELQMLNEVKDS